MSKVDVLLGLQWGDEGKGKIVDVLTPNYDFVARFQGGPNAGHTLEFDGKHVVLRSIPSGVFQCKDKNIIGNGVVFDPILFKKEYEELSEHISKLDKKIIISNKCFVITPFHGVQDMINEAKKGKNKVGTTGKGIGPAYTDKISRNGICLEDALYNKAKLHDFLNKQLEQIKRDIKLLDSDYAAALRFLDKSNNIDDEGSLMLLDGFYIALDWLEKSNIKIENTAYLVNKALEKDKSVLAEGAQGTMLDIDFGTYPFVTSSNTTSGGVCTGLGVGPNKIGEVYGIFKAYCTRVGSGPFPTEDFGEDGKRIRELGHEFGAVTGRERRCGWLDLVQLKYACMINGVTQLIMMKSDVLSQFDNIKVCVRYNDGTKDITEITNDLSSVTPVYKEFEGWKGYDLSQYDTFDSLPVAFKKYIKFIESYVDVPIKILSVGPDRTETIIR